MLETQRISIATSLFLEQLKPVSRDNIREFVRKCADRFNLATPIVDAACGYRTNQPETIRSRNHTNNPLYIAFDHTLNLGKPLEPNASLNLIADAAHIPLRNASIGAVLCTEALEHVPDDKLVLMEISRILRCGGRLILTLPGVDVPKHEKLPHQRDFRRYVTGNVKTMLRGNGFNDIEIEERYFKNAQINLLITAKKE